MIRRSICRDCARLDGTACPERHCTRPDMPVIECSMRVARIPHWVLLDNDPRAHLLDDRDFTAFGRLECLCGREVTPGYLAAPERAVSRAEQCSGCWLVWKVNEGLGVYDRPEVTQ